MCLKIDEATRKDLHTITDRYWKEIKKEGLQCAIKNCYIADANGYKENGLLFRELEAAEKCGNVQNFEPGGVLVLLVGHSFDPLLQMIVCKKPAEILLVLSNNYGEDCTGHMRGGHIEDLIKCLHKHEYIEKCPVILNKLNKHDENDYDPIEDNPTEVFRFLCRYLIDKLENNQVTIDITGGKKSMVSGAFLFAAYAGVTVTYVDFEEYNIEKGRPYGFTCKIGSIQNPYQSFALHQWGEVERFYKDGSFEQAKIVLDRIIAAMNSGEDNSPKLFYEHQIKAVIKLQKMLCMYHFWDNGDFHRANEKWQEIGFKNEDNNVPKAVSVFGGSEWPKMRDKTGKDQNCTDFLFDLKCFDNKFYSNPNFVVTYTADELERINRLIEIRKDFRAAFQRAASLYEVLMKVRVLNLWEKGWVQVEFSYNGKDFTINLSDTDKINELARQLKVRSEVIKKNIREKVREQIYTFATWEVLRGILNKENNSSKSYGIWERSIILMGKIKVETKIFGRKKSPVNFDESKICSNHFTGLNFRDLRNKSFHTYPPIPERIAREAYLNVEASFKDLTENLWKSIGIISPNNLENKRLNSLPWKELCQLCEVNFLPPIQEGGKS